MEWLDMLATGAGGVLGGVLSIGGQWLTHKQAIEMERLKLDGRRVELEHELALIPLETARAMQESEAAIELSNTQGSWEGLTASYQAEGASAAAGTYKWVEAVRSLTRPVLTLGSLAGIGGIALLGDPAYGMEAAATLQFVGTTSAAWWFGDRAFTRAKQ